MRELVKLRRRFILILMSSVGLVLTVALLVSVVGSFSTQYAHIQDSLNTALVIEGEDGLRPHIGEQGSTPPPEGLIPESPLSNDSILLDIGKYKEYKALISSRDTIGMVPVYVIDVLVDTGETIVYGNATSMDDATLDKALSRIQENDADSGVFLDLGLFYQRVIGEENVARVAFADASQIYDNTLYLALMALLIWVGAMVVFLILSILLSRMVLRPVEDAWTKQREFIADASHELKTPLTIILANNNIVMSHPEKSTKEQQQWLESTEEEAHRMDGLISDLLLLAQIDHDEDSAEGADPALTQDVIESDEEGETGSGQDDTTQLAPLDLSSLVERSVLQFDAVFFERHINVQSEIEPGLSLLGNPEHLRRLVTILLDNASKYGNEGGMVEVRLARTAEKRSVAELTVTNTGVLIPPQKISRIFDRFFRGDSAHSATTPGSGLGLALAKEIVTEHKGTITANSKPLEDTKDLAQTTFSIRLPLE